MTKGTKGPARSAAPRTFAILASTALIFAMWTVSKGEEQTATEPEKASAAQTTASVPAPVLLWPLGAPGALGTADEDKPSLSIYLPATNPTQTGILVFPGGGYSHLATGHEGDDIAHWLNDRGIAAFVLRYRLGPRYRHPIELGDAQRAIRYVRSHASEESILPDHVGVWGFSAGGHLAATAGTHFDQGQPTSADPVEQVGSRPDFLVLAYPVITMKDPYVHKGSKEMLLGEDPDPALVDLLSDETQVTAETPPTFLFHTTDDKTVPVMNSVMFYEALVKAGVPAELHVFQHGAHGSGLAKTSPTLYVWPELLHHWLQLHGWAAATDTPPAGK